MPDERKQAVVDTPGAVRDKIPLTAFHPGLRSLKKSRENIRSSAVGSNR